MEKKTATHSSNLAWKIPWTEEPGRLQSMVSQRVGHDWVTNEQQHNKKRGNTWVYIDFSWGADVPRCWLIGAQLFLEHHWSIEARIGKKSPLRMRIPVTKDYVVTGNGRLYPKSQIRLIAPQGSRNTWDQPLCSRTWQDPENSAWIHVLPTIPSTMRSCELECPPINVRLSWKWPKIRKDTRETKQS